MFIDFLVFLILGLRPLLGPRNCCRYSVSCTTFACEQLRNRSFFIAVFLILKRLLSCNPFKQG